MAIINLNDTTPAAPASETNCKWQADSNAPRNVSVYMPLMVGDSGSGGASGAVPAPGAGDAAAGKFLRADGSFAVPSTAASPVVLTVNASATVLVNSAAVSFDDTILINGDSDVVHA